MENGEVPQGIENKPTTPTEASNRIWDRMPAWVPVDALMGGVAEGMALFGSGNWKLDVTNSLIAGCCLATSLLGAKHAIQNENAQTAQETAKQESVK